MLVLVIWLTFRDSAGDIVYELQTTSLRIIFLICASSVIYHLFDAWMTFSLARRYNPDFKYYQAMYCAFYCSFYRLATLGSVQGVAAVYYLGQNGVAYSEAISLYMVQYVVHKIGIAIFSGILFLVSWNFMLEHYRHYVSLLLLAYAVTILICIGLILLVMWGKFHNLILRILQHFNKNGRLDQMLVKLETNAGIMSTAAKTVFKDGKQILKLLGITLMKYVFWYDIPFLVMGGTHLSFLHSLAVSSLGVMTAAVIPTPAGVGSSEFVMTLLFRPLVGIGTAGALTILYRIATFVFPFMVGSVVILIRRAILKKKGIEVKRPSFSKSE